MEGPVRVWCPSPFTEENTAIQRWSHTYKARESISTAGTLTKSSNFPFHLSDLTTWNFASIKYLEMLDKIE